jgi:hypothetical protein
VTNYYFFDMQPVSLDWLHAARFAADNLNTDIYPNFERSGRST